VAVVTGAQQDRAHPQQQEQQELVLVLGVLVAQQAHQAAQGVLALTQPQPMCSQAVVEAVLATAQVLRLVVLVACTVAVAVAAHHLLFQREALGLVAHW